MLELTAKDKLMEGKMGLNRDRKRMRSASAMSPQVVPREPPNKIATALAKHGGRHGQ